MLLHEFLILKNFFKNSKVLAELLNLRRHVRNSSGKAFKFRPVCFEFNFLSRSC